MINVANPYDKPSGFDFYADILRRPHESIKVHYKLIYAERLKREKIDEYTRKMHHVENSNLLEKNLLVERLEHYKAKLREIRSQKKLDLERFVSNTDHVNRTMPIKPLHNRARRTLIDNENRDVGNEELVIKQTEVLLEKQRTFLTSLDDFETTTITILKPKSAIRRSSSGEKVRKPTVKFQLDKISPSPNPSKAHPKKSQAKSALPNLNISTNLVTPQSQSNSRLAKLKLRKLAETPKKQPVYELPYELGEVVFPILVKSNTI